MYFSDNGSFKSCIRMVDAFNQRNCCPTAILQFLILILLCTYGYLRVSLASLENDFLYFTFKIFSYYVLVLHVADDGFAFV